jgi:DNA-binding CsgD family transcriptional regulator
LLDDGGVGFVIAHLVGFGASVGWLWLFFLMGPLLDPILARWSTDTEFVFLTFLLSHSLACLLLTRAKFLSSLLPRTYLLLGCSAVMAGTPSVLALLPLVTGFPVVVCWWLPYAMATVSAAALAVVQAAWMETFIVLSPQSGVVSFAGATAIAGGAAMVGGAVGTGSALILTALVPLVSFAVLVRLNFAVTPPPDALPAPAGLFILPRGLIVLIFLFYCGGGIMFQIISLDDAFKQSLYITNAAYIGTCLAVTVIVRYFPGADLRLLYRPVLLLLAVGFLLFPFLARNNGSGMPDWLLAPFICLQAGFALFDLYSWLQVARVAGRYRDHLPVCTFGLFCITFSIFVGGAAFRLLPSPASLVGRLDMLAWTAGFITLLAALFYYDTHEVAGAKAVAAAIPPPGDGGAPHHQLTRVEAMAVSHGLTTREQEVLVLLIRGRSIPVISDTLFISVNTVKYHIRHIYEKFAVQNRQQLLDLLEGNLP